MEQVILVDTNDNQIGVEEKIKAHQDGKLHRAFSILVFNQKGESLLQKRALDKYHCPGLWSNTCCSHPQPEESLENAAKRRLKEEMNISCDLEEIFSFIYKSEFKNGLTEHEFDHVLRGDYNENEIIPNSLEVAEWKWVNVEELKKDAESNPDQYTPWFKIILKKWD